MRCTVPPETPSLSVVFEALTEALQTDVLASAYHREFGRLCCEERDFGGYCLLIRVPCGSTNQFDQKQMVKRIVTFGVDLEL